MIFTAAGIKIISKAVPTRLGTVSSAVWRGLTKYFYLFLTQIRFAGKHNLITTKIDSYINRLLSTRERNSNYNLFHLVLIFPRRSWLFSNRFSGSASLGRKMGWKTVYFSFRVLKIGVGKSCKLNQLREVNEDEVSYWPKWSSWIQTFSGLVIVYNYIILKAIKLSFLLL